MVTSAHAGRPQRGLSVFLQTPADADAARSYADAIDAIRLAEQLGYDTAWIAEAHFAPIGLPAALTFLAAAAQQTTRIRLGTAVVPLVFDNPIRLIETAAVADALSAGRIELGVGKSNGYGFSTSAFAAFRLSEEDKDVLYERTIVDVHTLLDGWVDTGEQELPLYPPPASLRSRVWQATATPANAEAIGRAGDGILLHRLAFSGETGPVQADLIDHYLAAYEGRQAPRIGVSRAVLPATSRREAADLLREDFALDPRKYAAFGAASVEEFLIKSNVYYGTVDEIADALNEDAAVRRATDYLFNVPLQNGSREFRDILRVVADELYPRLPLGSRRVVA